jgi:hypothetical protein
VAGILASGGTRVDRRWSNVATELRSSIGDEEQAYHFGSSLRFPWTRRLATGTPLAGASASEPASGLAGRRRSASSRRRRTAAGQGADTRAPQGRVRTALKGAGREVPPGKNAKKIGGGALAVSAMDTGHGRGTGPEWAPRGLGPVLG